MTQSSEGDDDTPQDVPLTKGQLQRIVKFSVLPYIQELFATQYGQPDEEILRGSEELLLSCLPPVG